MGRSITERPIVAPATYYHQPSNRHYQITLRERKRTEGALARSRPPGREASISRHQLDEKGQAINSIEKSIDLSIGSGNHAITYLNRTPQGRLLELPLSWYTKLNGYAMSPGYENSDHLDFRREISDSCLFCHSAGKQPAPIDCQRCHGPAQAHAAHPSKSNILNPARLTPQRQLETCLQCHLETASQGIVDSIRKPGRDVFSYRPGDPLSDYKSYFAPPTPQRFEINHAGFRLLQSRCFLESKGAMTCTTCHDPHSARVKTGSCQSCHKQPHTTEACTTCHMPKRTAADAIHTQMTDHKITRRPETEDQTLYTGPVIDFYTKADPDTLAVANDKEGDPAVYRRYLQRDPTNQPVLVSLGKALLRRNQPAEAAATLQKAVQLDSRDTNAQTYLAVAEAVQGNTQKALAILKQAVASNPDHALARINLGITHEALGDVQSALADYAEALRLQPDSAEAKQRRDALLKR
ncbi:MAG: tetratricopeptide repeat protein [Bryobacteraceae bacterium]